MQSRLKLFCGASTRNGQPCKSRRLFCSGRCRNHGGLSTGPKTSEGKRVALANLEKGRGSRNRNLEREYNND